MTLVRRGWMLWAGMMAGCCIMAGLRRDSLVVATAAGRAVQVAGGDAARREIEAFNRKYVEAHLKMDNVAIMNTWTKDGVALLPATAPMVGKAAIGEFLNHVTTEMKGYRMEKVEMDFQGIETNGEWASEWAYEHQLVQPPDEKPMIDSYGKLLLVLHKEADGNWRVKREMWNQGVKP